jgi:lipid A disaccharide synthetase
MFYHFAKKFDNFNPSPVVITDDRYQAMRNCDLIITCSGTASLEASIMGIPQIFFNLPSFFDYYIFRYFLKIREYNLTNLCSGKKIVPSFVVRNKKKLIKNIVTLTTEYIDGPELWTKVQGIFENEVDSDDFQKNNTTK